MKWFDIKSETANGVEQVDSESYSKIKTILRDSDSFYLFI